MSDRDLKIVVVYGGTSSEREISLRSGAAIYNALKQGGYRNVSLFDLTKESLKRLLDTPMELAFLALHGKGGEDGCIQGMLELAGIPYTGSSVETSAICMNKIRTKELLSNAGLPTPKYISLHASDCADREKIANMLCEKIGIPMVVKSPNEGSSIGVFIVKEREKLVYAIDEVLSKGDFLLAEEFINGKELTLPILGNEELTVFPAVEITSENEFYDYQAKYTQGMCHHIIPARISPSVQKRLEKIGKEAYRMLSCSGLARIDFMLSQEQEPTIIEINTLPGMTEMSLFPDSARYAGVPFDELTHRIVQLALEKQKK